MQNFPIRFEIHVCVLLQAIQNLRDVAALISPERHYAYALGFPGGFHADCTWPHKFTEMGQIQLRPLLSQQIYPPHYVGALELLIKSVLLQPNALYRIEEWAQPYDPALRPAQQ